MQLLPIILVAVVMAVDGGLTPLGAKWHVPPSLVWLDLWLLPLLLGGLAWLHVARCGRRIGRAGGMRALLSAERTIRVTRWLIALNHIAAIVVLDGLGAVRRLTGDLILIDELITILPAMLGLVATWWIYYPIERRLLDASFLRRLDSGTPVYPKLTRWRYVVVQARMQVLLTLVPVLAIAGLSELIDDVWPGAGSGPTGAWGWGRETLTIAAAATVFLFSPLIARGVLDTQSLPEGGLRASLSEVCRRHRVGVRDLLLWNTNGSMINAAVMGLIAPLRYVLITDALLETLRENEVRAVMAHEVGHVRRRHMAWMVLCLLACFVLAAHAVQWPLRLASPVLRIPSFWSEQVIVISAVVQLALGLTIFGWVCRRFERQADSFAVQHLSGLGTPGQESASITAESVDSLRNALETIAELNTVDPSRHSWRHGSIRWRQRYLESLIGRPVLGLPIDRLVSGLKLAAAFVLLLGIAYEIFVQQFGPQDDSSSRMAHVDHALHGGQA